MKNGKTLSTPKQCQGEINNSTTNSSLLTEWSKEGFCTGFSKYATENAEDIHTFLKQIKKNPKEVDNFSPRQFEQIVCEMLKIIGYEVFLTQQTHDGGKDIAASKNDLIVDNMYYVECKHYRKDRPVDVEIVRALYGVVTKDNVNAGIIITTSYFTDAAQKEIIGIAHRMSLIQFSQLLDICLNSL